MSIWFTHRFPGRPYELHMDVYMPPGDLSGFNIRLHLSYNDEYLGHAFVSPVTYSMMAMYFDENEWIERADAEEMYETVRHTIYLMRTGELPPPQEEIINR